MMRINLAVVGLCTGLTVLGWSYAFGDNNAGEWVRVARDPNYDVAIDSARIMPIMERSEERPTYPAYEVWYRTDHKKSRLYHGKPFDREVVRSVVQCDSLWYKVVRVDMSRDGRAVARQYTPPNERRKEPWRRVVRGTTEEIAARAGCFYGDRLFAAKRDRGIDVRRAPSGQVAP